MKSQKKTLKFFLWNTLCVILLSCIINSIIWIALHGIPIIGLPKIESVKSVTIVYNATQKIEIIDNENIALLIKSANLLNYKIKGKMEGSPIISITYHMKNGNDINIEANNTTMWWHGKPHTIKEKNVFVDIIQGLFFG